MKEGVREGGREEKIERGGKGRRGGGRERLKEGVREGGREGKIERGGKGRREGGKD